MNEKEKLNPLSEPDPHATLFNWVIVARGISDLFAATKGFIDESGGKTVYQKLSGYRFGVEGLRPPEVDEGAATE